MTPTIRAARPRATLAALPIALLASLACASRQASAPPAATAPMPASAAAPAAAPLYRPRSVTRAFAAGTRAADGRPGPKYWQNRARYEIGISVAPPNRLLLGTERIMYHNASPDTLRSIVFKLFGNIHKPGAPRASGASDDYLTSGVSVDAFSVNGTAVPWGDDAGVFTWKRVKLPTPLLPHDSVAMAVRWRSMLSRESGREGAIDLSTFFLAYFYPRVAVYDDVEGWDTMDFNDRQEFYSDFNSYTVNVTAPANFVVWGTGELYDADSVLQPAALARYRASMTSDTTIHVSTRAQLEGRAITRQAKTLEWRFRATNVPDVAFALSDHYAWDAGSVVVDSATRRRASVQSAYNDTTIDFPHMVQFGRHALGWLSSRWPGVPYPYEKTTIVQGFADMEYPMMVNDSPTSDTTFSRFVAEHEIAHTWFPFYMGINETRYAFMDEGWATTFEYLINQSDVGPDKAADFYRQFRVNRWAHDPSPLEDLPIVTPADVLGGVAYGNNAYGKPSLGYLALKDMLGDDAFRKALHGFMDRWHGKHPIPWDFFNSVNDLSGRDLNWFWRSWFFSNGYVDLGVEGVTGDAAGAGAGGSMVVIRNVGGLPAPFDLVVTYADGSVERVHSTSAVWERDLARTSVTVPGAQAVRSVAIDSGIWADAEPANDRWAGGNGA
jgi:Peptidase family M1 domain